MIAKQYYHDIDLVKVGQLLNARLHNVDNAGMSALGATLGTANKGLSVWNTEGNYESIWDGTQWINQGASSVTGDIVFKGFIDASLAIDSGSQPQTVQYVSGYQYVVTTAGTFQAGSSGVTLQGNQALEVGDQILFVSATSAYAIQRNDIAATTTVAGNIRLATQSEVNAGTEATAAVTSATLHGTLVTGGYTKQYFNTVNITAATPLTVTHNLNLTNRDAFQINTMFGNSQVSLDVDSVDANSLTLTSLVSLTGVAVTVTGASAS